MVVLGASESRDLRAAWKEYTRKVFPHAFTQIRNFLLVSISEGRSFDDVDWTLVSESGKSKRTMNLFGIRIKATICEDWWFLLQHRTVFKPCSSNLDESGLCGFVFLFWKVAQGASLSAVAVL